MIARIAAFFRAVVAHRDEIAIVALGLVYQLTFGARADATHRHHEEVVVRVRTAAAHAPPAMRHETVHAVRPVVRVVPAKAVAPVRVKVKPAKPAAPARVLCVEERARVVVATGEAVTVHRGRALTDAEARCAREQAERVRAAVARAMAMEQVARSGHAVAAADVALAAVAGLN